MYISVITYDDIATTVIEFEEPSSNLCENIIFTGYGTNFLNPMKTAYDLAKKY